MATWAEFKTWIGSAQAEGTVSHLYLDTEGLVTVGVGNMLPTAAAATALGFVDRKTKAPASKAAIEADFAAVKAQPKGQIASAYQKHTALDLPAAAIDTLLDKRIAEFKKQLIVKFPKYNTYPVAGQLAIMDMAFNLGTSGLVTKFPSFKKAVEAGDWTKAATESNRPQLSATRNSKVKAWLAEAAKASK